MQVRKQQLELDMEQQTGSKEEKVPGAGILHIECILHTECSTFHSIMFQDLE